MSNNEQLEAYARIARMPYSKLLGPADCVVPDVYDLLFDKIRQQRRATTTLDQDRWTALSMFNVPSEMLEAKLAWDTFVADIPVECRPGPYDHLSPPKQTLRPITFMVDTRLLDELLELSDWARRSTIAAMGGYALRGGNVERLDWHGSQPHVIVLHLEAQAPQVKQPDWPADSLSEPCPKCNRILFKGDTCWFCEG